MSIPPFRPGEGLDPDGQEMAGIRIPNRGGITYAGRPSYGKDTRRTTDRRLYDQIADANDSIDSNMKEGFEQPTDVAFANFVFTAKGSTAEVVARVQQARRKNLISVSQAEEVEQLGVPLGKMMGGFIKYLSESGFTDRGRHNVAPTPPRPRNPRRR